jgi:hypothetical protein
VEWGVCNASARKLQLARNRREYAQWLARVLDEDWAFWRARWEADAPTAVTRWRAANEAFVARAPGPSEGTASAHDVAWRLKPAPWLRDSLVGTLLLDAVDGALPGDWLAALPTAPVSACGHAGADDGRDGKDGRDLVDRWGAHLRATAVGRLAALAVDVALVAWRWRSSGDAEGDVAVGRPALCPGCAFERIEGPRARAAAVALARVALEAAPPRPSLVARLVRDACARLPRDRAVAFFTALGDGPLPRAAAAAAAAAAAGARAT